MLVKLLINKNITDFGRFCNLHIPCLRINIAVIFMSSSRMSLNFAVLGILGARCGLGLGDAG